LPKGTLAAFEFLTVDSPIERIDFHLGRLVMVNAAPHALIPHLPP
jgi:hypothetical protein